MDADYVVGQVASEVGGRTERRRRKPSSSTRSRRKLREIFGGAAPGLCKKRSSEEDSKMTPLTAPREDATEKEASSSLPLDRKRASGESPEKEDILPLRRREKSADHRTVFVGNLPLSVKKGDLNKLFSKYGTIENLRFRCAVPSDPKKGKKFAVIKQQFLPSQKNKKAFVCFKDVESAKKALAANGIKIDEHHIRVDMASDSIKYDHSRCVFVGNLPFNVEEEAMRKHFEVCGTITNIRLIRARKTGLGKGFGYVCFQAKDGVSFALKLNNSKLCNRKIRVKRCDPEHKKQRKSYTKPEWKITRQKKKIYPSTISGKNFQGLKAVQKKKKLSAKKAKVAGRN